MLRVGLTGGIGAGKSTVAGLLLERGAVLVDADRIAREVVEPGTPGFDAVVAEFGADVLAPDGSLDRARLGRVVFADEARRRTLNAIVHPLVYERRIEVLGTAARDAVIVEDIPLLVENDLGAGFHLVVVVHAPVEMRVARLVASRGMDADDVRARIRSQADDAARRAAADVWLDNSAGPDGLTGAVDTLWTERLVPYESNLRHGRRAPRQPHAVIVAADPGWAEQARRLVARIELAAGERAVRVDHIGSTSVPGLAAKDVIDVQVVVPDLRTADELLAHVGAAGMVPLPGQWSDVGRDGREYEKRFAANADPGRAVNVHVRQQSSPAWRDAVLLRDWLREHADAVGEYAALKRRLAAQPHDTIDDYADTKTPWIAAALTRADDWAGRRRWTP